MSRFKNSQLGVTLIELIIAIVIISIASVALLQGLGFQTTRNVDPLIQAQAQLIARNYLEEVQSRAFFDSAADPRLDPTLTQAAATTSVLDATQTGAPSRLAWDNIYEYDGFNSAPTDETGTAISELSSFQVSINIDASTSVTLGTLTNSATANCPAQILLIEVTVLDPRGQSMQLSGYRTSYFESPAAWGC